MMFFSVSEPESRLVRQKSRLTLTSTSQVNQPKVIGGDISENAKIKYFDGSGEDVTPVPLFVPPEQDDEDNDEVEDDATKRKPRKNVMQTFLKVFFNK